jgi:hypothetical protein
MKQVKCCINRLNQATKNLARTARILFSLQNPTPHSFFILVDLLIKDNLLSKTLGLKTAILAEPSELNAGRPGQNSKNFFLYKTPTHCVGLVRKV